jgi:hypothetical protein
MSEDDDEGLEKVLVALPNHWATGGESIWAKPLGKDEYELRNSPFYAYGLNWGDIVLAISAEPDLKPLVRKVVRPSGNRTLRVFFGDNLSRESQNEYLDGLKDLGLSYERATGHLVALDVEANGDYDAICDELWKLEKEGVLQYETCEARAEGRFDDGPEVDDEIEGHEYEN